MPKVRLLVLTCLGTIIIGALASSSALAGEWMVEGKPLSGTEELATSALVLAEGELKVLPAVTTIKCTAHEVGIAGGKIIAPDGILASSISFKQCEGEGACAGIANSKEIKTLPIDGLASLDGSLATYILVLPETKTTFATIGFTNELCALFPTQPVTGDASLLAHDGFDEQVRHRVLGFSLPKALKVGSSEADLRGLVGDIELKSKKSWSFL